MKKGGKVCAVGETRTWNGKKYKKMPNKKWVRVYDKESRGARVAIAVLRRKINACTNSQELLNLILENRERFSDTEGKPLDIVLELKKEVDARRRILNAGKDINKKQGVAAKLRETFNKNTDKYLNTDFTNKPTGIAAVFSKESQKELKSRTNNTKANGFTLQEHFEVANQIKELFENATLEKTHDDIKHGDKNLKIERFLSKKITLNSGKKVQACITVKHSLDKNGRIIYSIEAMDIKNALEKTRAKGQPKNQPVLTPDNITHNGTVVNEKDRETASRKVSSGTYKRTQKRDVKKSYSAIVKSLLANMGNENDKG